MFNFQVHAALCRPSKNISVYIGILEDKSDSIIMANCFQILCSVDPRLLRLTPHDDMIYKAFREEFTNMDIKILNENEIKSPEGKQVIFFQ